MALWIIRAGSHGEREDFALENKFAVIGWDDLQDLSTIDQRNNLKQLIHKTYPDEGTNTLRNWESQIWPFIKTIQPGDLVALPLKQRSIIALAEISGSYQYKPEHPDGARHVRPVKEWKEFPRKSFEKDLLYSFGAFMTVCRIQRNKAEARIHDIYTGQPTTPQPPTLSESTVESPETNVDLERISKDQIVSFIERKFKGHKLAHLIGAILVAQGYQVRVSQEGPDGGIDILAGQGVFGFDSPRLAVQVKSQSTTVGIGVINELQGAMQRYGADQGLVVAWGGVSTSAEREAARQYFRIRLWDSDMVVRMLEENYDRLPSSIQAEMPLKRIWTLVQEDEED